MNSKNKKYITVFVLVVIAITFSIFIKKDMTEYENLKFIVYTDEEFDYVELKIDDFEAKIEKPEHIDTISYSPSLLACLEQKKYEDVSIKVYKHDKLIVYEHGIDIDLSNEKRVVIKLKEKNKDKLMVVLES